MAKWLLDRYFAHLESILVPLQVDTAVDIGCGKGYVTNHVRNVCLSRQIRSTSS
jgi:hypothetical protein